MKKLPLALAVLGASTLPPTAQAQSSGAPGALEEVVITAQRKSESLQDAAIPVDAATQRELARAGISDATGLSKISPALTVSSGGGSNNVFFVRGVGNFAVNAYTDSALAFNVDGVYIGRPTATTASFLDVDRIEVLKGPQGTLYGRNATAGAINVIPVAPSVGEFEGDLTLGVGNYGALEGSGAINIPLGDSWATRISAAILENDGYNDDDTYATDDSALRVQLYGELSDRSDIRISADYSTTKGTGNAPTYLGSYGFPFAGPSNNPNNVPGYNFTPAPSNVASPWSGPYTDSASAWYESLTTTPAFTNAGPQLDSSLDNTYWGVTAHLNVDLGFGDLVVIPAYRESDLDLVFVNPGFRAAINKDTAEQVSLEARLSFDTGPVDWILGAYYFDETVDGAAAFNQQSLQSTTTINESSTESKALFARGTFNVSDSLRLVGAVRWTDDEKTFDAVQNQFVNVCIRDLPVFPGGPELPNCEGAPVIPAGATVEETLAQIDPADLPLGAPGIGTGPVPYGQIPLFPGAPPFLRANILMINPTSVDDTQEASEVTYRAAIEYDVNLDSLVYASFESGYRSGGFSLATGRESYDPEFIDAYTIGSKNRFFEDRLQLNAELFYWEYEDQQYSHLGLDVNGNNAFLTENIGSSTIQGLEIDALFMATESTRVRANIQYLDNVLDEYGYTEPTPDAAVRVITGCDSNLLLTNPDGSALWNVDCSGNDGQNSPELTGTLGLDQSFEIGGLSAMLSLDMRYRDERWIGFNYAPFQRADSVTTYGASFEIGSSDGSWSALAYVRNITDEDVQSIGQVLGNVGRLASTVYEPPRTYGVRLNYRF